MTTRNELQRLFYPSSLAVVGASQNELKGGGYILKGLIDGGFTGQLYPVNPGESDLMGLKCYASVADIPGRVDVAVVALPARLVPGVIAECGERKVPYVVVHSAGFSELDAAGKELEDEMLRVARRYGVRLVGPNCMGIYNPTLGLNTVTPRAPLGREGGPVAFLSQSGWAGENTIQIGYERGLRFSQGASIGNQIDLTVEDYLRYFAEDDRTRVIVAYIEGIRKGREFLRLAKEVTRRKPMIVWKGGRSRLGARATASHTGSLAGSATAFDAVARQSGIVAAQNLEDMVDLAVGFSCPVLPRGSRVGIMVEAGGAAVASTDISEDLGLGIPALSAEAQQAIEGVVRGRLPVSSSRQNPVDLVWVPDDISFEVYVGVARIMLREVDAQLVVGYVPLEEPFAAALAGVRDETGKPVFFVPGWHTASRPGMSILTRAGIPAFAVPERALRVLAAMVRWGRYLTRR